LRQRRVIAGRGGRTCQLEEGEKKKRVTRRRCEPQLGVREDRRTILNGGVYAAGDPRGHKKSGKLWGAYLGSIQLSNRSMRGPWLPLINGEAHEEKKGEGSRKKTWHDAGH